MKSNTKLSLFVIGALIASQASASINLDAIFNAMDDWRGATIFEFFVMEFLGPVMCVLAGTAWPLGAALYGALSQD